MCCRYSLDRSLSSWANILPPPPQLYLGVVAGSSVLPVLEVPDEQWPHSNWLSVQFSLRITNSNPPIAVSNLNNKFVFGSTLQDSAVSIPGSPFQGKDLGYNTMIIKNLTAAQLYGGNVSAVCASQCTAAGFSHSHAQLQCRCWNGVDSLKYDYTLQHQAAPIVCGQGDYAAWSRVPSPFGKCQCSSNCGSSPYKTSTLTLQAGSSYTIQNAAATIQLPLPPRYEVSLSMGSQFLSLDAGNASTTITVTADPVSYTHLTLPTICSV